MPDSKTAPGKSANSPEPDLDKLADQCAVGAVPIPDDLPDHQQQQLLVTIAARRRKRLFHLFAAAIADDIWREQQP